MAKLSFATDIGPLFRTFDIESMTPAGLDLSSYDAVKGQAAAIYKAITEKRMPCDAPWTPEKRKKFKAWMDGGLLP